MHTCFSVPCFGDGLSPLYLTETMASNRISSIALAWVPTTLAILPEIHDNNASRAPASQSERKRAPALPFSISGQKGVKMSVRKTPPKPNRIMPSLWAAVLSLIGLPLFFLPSPSEPEISTPRANPIPLHFADDQKARVKTQRTGDEALSVSPCASEKKTELAKGKFLVASRDLIDLNFSQSVVLLIEYGPNGAMGLVINRPTEVQLSEVLPDMAELAHRGEILFIGGPVARNQLLMLIRSDREIEGAHLVFEDVYASTSRTVLEEMVNRSGPGERFRVYAGYAGWASGQLDQEFSRGDWHVLRADRETVFEKEPSQIWNELIRWSAGQWVETRPSLQRHSDVRPLKNPRSWFSAPNAGVSKKS